MSTLSGEGLTVTDSDAGSFRTWYESLLWNWMDHLGITESVERKIMAAVVIQFLSTLAVFGLPLVFLGPREAFRGALLAHPGEVREVARLAPPFNESPRHAVEAEHERALGLGSGSAHDSIEKATVGGVARRRLCYRSYSPPTAGRVDPVRSP